MNLGSESNPRISIGEKGNKELAVFTNGQDVSLASTLKSVPASVVKGEVLGKSGEPIVAPSLNKFKWEILPEPVHGMYSEAYPCRIFTEKKVRSQSSA